LGVSTLSAQPNVGQWDFDLGDLSQSSGANLGPLVYADGPNGSTSNLTVFGTTTALNVPGINGSAANIMRFPGESRLGPMGFIMPTPPANGDNPEGVSLVNDYTIIYDVLYTNSGVFRPLLQMDDGQLDHILAMLAINANDQVAVTNTQGASLPSGAFGQIAAGVWYRIGFAVSMDAGEIDVYTNGQPVGSLVIGQGQWDGPYALYSGDLPVFCSNVTNADGFANSVQLRDQVLNPGQMEALGGPTASGIPVTLPAAHSYIANRTPAFGQIDVTPSPRVHVDLSQGNSTIDSGSIQLALDGVTLLASVAPGTNNDFVIDYPVTNVLDQLSTHTLTLSYHDSISGSRVKSWQFRVANYQIVNLPPPIYFEDFEKVPVVNDTSIAGDADRVRRLEHRAQRAFHAIADRLGSEQLHGGAA